jgi:hypothetical protein
MRHIKAAILAAMVAGSTLLVVSPAQASCTEYVEGRCLENDVCAAIGRVTGRPVNCIE